jgi:hypothetical protein
MRPRLSATAGVAGSINAAEAPDPDGTERLPGKRSAAQKATPAAEGEERELLLPAIRKLGQVLRKDFAAAIARDPRGFKKCVVSLVRAELPPHAGRYCEESVSRGELLHKHGKPWPLIYAECLPENADPVAKSNLRAAIRARQNRRKHRRAGEDGKRGEQSTSHIVSLY